VTRDETIDHFGIEDGMLLFDPPHLFDRAIIGIARRACQPSVVCYDYSTIVELYVADGMEEDEAIEFIEYNTLGAWAGEGTPIVLCRP